jgi:hypothetical protein
MPAGLAPLRGPPVCHYPLCHPPCVTTPCVPWYTTAGCSVSSVPGQPWSTSFTVTVPSGDATVALLTAVSVTTGGYSGPDPCLAAASTAGAWARGVDSVRTAAVQWWTAFWQRSSVSLPTQPALEALWVGGQYILACTASTDASVPPPGDSPPCVACSPCTLVVLPPSPLGQVQEEETRWCGVVAGVSLILCAGLYGVWTTSDNAGWNGDATLDYNYEST